MGERSGPTLIQSVQRALRLLEVVAERDGRVHAKEIARAGLKRDYEAYLRQQRGLSERTIFHAWRFADRFLLIRFGDGIGDLSQVTSADIVDFLGHLTTRTPPFRDKTPSTHLRNFFRYLFKAGKTATNLSL